MKTRICAATLAATLAATALDATAMLPSTGAGFLDPTFGNNGAQTLAVRNGYEGAYELVALPDGRWIVSGGAQSIGQEDGVHWLARLQPDGRLDPSFGTNGLVTDHRYVSVIAAQPDGKLLTVSATMEGNFQRGVLERLLPDGAADAGFGTGGRTLISTATAAMPWQDFESLAVDGSGRIYASARRYNDNFTAGKIELWRFSSDGVPDPAFGNTGRVVLDDVGGASSLVFNSHVRVMPDGRVVVGAWCQATRNDATRICVVRLKADGTRDGSFGPNGVRDIAPPAAASYPLYDVRIGGDGKVTIAATNFGNGAKAIVLRLKLDGTMDEGFGQGGIATLSWTGETAYAFRVFPQADGKTLVVGAVNEFNDQSFGYVARLTASGQPDPTFGVNGIAPRVGTNPTWFDAGAVLADGAILGVGQSIAAPGAFEQIDSLFVRVVGVETTTPVIEFHNATLNHYFITADAIEAAAIDAGAAGPGWSRTGQTFKSGGPSRVCRFYGSPDLDAATGQRRGPNSHFYTIEAPECGAVKGDPGWKFESYDFSGWPASSAGCQPGTVPVKRAYNGRFAENDSNHRYATSDAVYQAMTAQGWHGEGTVFCAVP